MELGQRGAQLLAVRLTQQDGPAQQRLGKHWYLGSADAIYQTINIIEDVQPDIVVIVGADHVYRMDFQQMVQQHIESGAEFTVSPSASPTSSV